MHWFFIDLCLWSRTRSVHIVRLLTINFNERFTSSNLKTYLHVILHAGLARSCRIHIFKKRKISFTLGRRSPLPRRARVIFWMMDSATSLFCSAQNDRGGGILRRVKVFGLEKPSKSGLGCTCIGYWLISVFDQEQVRLISCYFQPYTSMNDLLLPIFKLTYMSFCTQG